MRPVAVTLMPPSSSKTVSSRVGWALGSSVGSGVAVASSVAAAEDSASEEAVLPALLSEAVLWVLPLLPHAARERTSSAESRKDMNFFI